MKGRWQRLERRARQLRRLVQAIVAFVFVGALGQAFGMGQRGRSIWLALGLLIAAYLILLVLERRDPKTAALSKGGELM